jgi:hypothetical protein
MISKDYKQNKKQVLKFYEDYISACKLADIKQNSSIDKQAEKIRNEIFNLMILGEAKSGKSTFINAFLGCEVVPMDVRQCTSAIIKIRRGDKFELVATTAGGGKSVINGFDKIQKFLKDHAAISDEYRSIPLTTINNELLIIYKGQIPKNVLDDFLETEVKDNIFNLDIDEYNSKIRKYINEQAPKWKEIITEMEITYQLPEAMQGITMIDSPGVGAGGNVGKIAENYIDNANAIIFVKSLSGQAVESQSFMNFLRNNCAERKKDSLFLVLTGKSTLQRSEFERLKEQTVEMYKNDIREEKILFVDSKMQLFLNKCLELGTEEKISAFYDRLEEEENDFAPASKPWLKTKDVDSYKEKMEDASNFRSVLTAIEKFARVANYLQLIDFLDALVREYEHYKGIFNEALKIAEENVNDPVSLEDRIKEKKNELNDVYNKINHNISEIYKNYTDNLNGEGIIANRSDQKREVYKEELKKFKALEEGQISDQTFSSLKKVTMDSIADSKEFRQELAQNFLGDCNEKLIEYTDDPSKIPAEAYTPNFTETDFDSINEEAKDNTSGYDDVEDGVTFLKTTSKVPYHHLKKHVRLVVESIDRRLDYEIVPKMVDNIMNYVEKCRDIYMNKLKERKESLEKEYQKLLDDKDDNEKQLKNVNELQSKYNLCVNAINELDEERKELKNYVGE